MRFAAIVVVALMAASPVMANLLVNGGFEAGVTADWSSSPKAWEINSGIHGPGAAPEGSNYGSIQTGGNDRSPFLVWQTVDVPAGTPALSVSGQWAGGQAEWAADTGVWVYDGAGTGGAELYSDYQYLDGIGGGAGAPWTPFATVIPAPGGGFDGDQVTVAFGWQNSSGNWSNGSACHADALDVTAVPEPATMSLLGLAGLALLRRRR